MQQLMEELGGGGHLNVAGAQLKGVSLERAHRIIMDVIDKYFTHTMSRVGGIGMEEIGAAVEYHHSHAFDPLGLGVDTRVDSVGVHKLREGERSEQHLYDAETIVLLQEAVREGSYEKFRRYSQRLSEKRSPQTLRGQ